MVICRETIAAQHIDTINENSQSLGLFLLVLSSFVYFFFDEIPVSISSWKWVIGQ